MKELKIELIENGADVESAKARLAEIDAERRALQEIVDAERLTKRAQIIASVRETVQAHQLSAADLGFVGAWLSAQLAAGREKEEFLIAK